MARPPVQDEVQKELALQKARLEIAEIKGRIEELKKPWWRKFSMSAPTATVIVGLLTFLGAWQSGYFSNERAKLQDEVRDLTTRRDQLQLTLKAAIKQYRQALSGMLLNDSYVLTLEDAFLTPERVCFDDNERVEKDPPISAASFMLERSREFSFRKTLDNPSGTKLDYILKEILVEFELGKTFAFEKLLLRNGVKVDKPEDTATLLKQPIYISRKSLQEFCKAGETQGTTDVFLEEMNRVRNVRAVAHVVAQQIVYFIMKDLNGFDDEEILPMKQEIEVTK